MELKSYRKDLQRQYASRRTHTKEYGEMLSAEVGNMWSDPCFLYDYYWDIMDYKLGKKIPFKLWDKQRELVWGLNNYPYWVNLKSRRMGFTEIIAREALKDSLLKMNQNCVVVSKNQRFSDDFINKIRNQHNWLHGIADFLRSPLLKDRTDMLHFGYEQKDDLGTSITKGRNSMIQAFPRGESAVVGATTTKVIIDEMSLQDNTHDLFAYTWPTIEGTDADFIISGTARGYGNKHTQLFQQAIDYWKHGKKDRETKFKSFFMGYYDRPGRTEATWRADLREIGNINKMKQEYPRTPEEAFQASSECIFDIPALKYMLNNAPLKPQEGYGNLIADRPQLSEGIFGKCITSTIEFIPMDIGGELKVFHLPNLEYSYGAGVDCAMGTAKGNYTVCHIFNLITGAQCAVYRSRKNPEQCANDIEILCKWYGEPLVVIEKDGPGLAFLQRFRQVYNKIYGRETIDGIIDKVNYQKLGTSTRSTTKIAYMGLVQTFIYNCVNREKRENGEDAVNGRSSFGWIYDTVTLEECLNFVETETGRIEADKSAKMDTEAEGSEKMNDDTVLALMQYCIGLKAEGRQYANSDTKPVKMTEADKVWDKAGYFKRKEKTELLMRNRQSVNKILNSLEINKSLRSRNAYSRRLQQ